MNKREELYFENEKEEFCCVYCKEDMTEEEHEDRYDHRHDGALCDDCEAVQKIDDESWRD